MNIAVTGGRDYAPPDAHIASAFKRVARAQPFSVLHGEAAGVDRAVDQWARSVNRPISRFPARWSQFGRAAGPIRNISMLSHAHVLIAFPGGKGTAHAVRTALRLNLPVLHVDRAGQSHFSPREDLQCTLPL